MGRVTLSRRVIDGLRFAGLSVLALPAAAQCTPTLQPPMPIAGVDGEVRAFAVWDPDGAGPLQPRTVIGGDFEIAGDEVCIDIAQLDPVSGKWQPLGNLPSGFGRSIEVLLVLPGGDLIAGGDDLTSAGADIVRWDGTGWQPLGSANSGLIKSMAVAPNGDLVVGGSFSSIDGVAAQNIARWDGATWSPLGTGSNGDGRALCFAANGDLYASGYFSLGGSQAHRLARWDGNSWLAVGNGIQGGDVNTLLLLSNGQMLVGGAFNTVDGGALVASCVALWDGVSWQAMGSGVGNAVHDACELPNGEVVVAGRFLYASGVLANGVAMWNGSAWSAPSPVLTADLPYAKQRCALGANGRLHVGGFRGDGFLGVAEWDGVQWAAPANGIDGSVTATAVGPDGAVYIAGAFHALVDGRADGIARWDGASWQPLGSGLQGTVQAIAVAPDGLVYAGGLFETAGAVPALHMAMWNGATWQALGGGITNATYANGSSLIEAMVVMQNGDLVVAGGFDNADGIAAAGVARWDGQAWHAMGNGIGVGVTRALALRDGALYAGGTQGVWRWDGSAWLGSGSWFNGPVEALSFLPDGQLLAGGTFTSAGGTPANGVARWNGTLWWPLGSGLTSAYALTLLPDGDLVAAGSGTVAGVGGNGLFRWHGNSWTRLGDVSSRSASSIAWSDHGELVCGGLFEEIGSEPHAWLARYATACGAEVASQGVGCAGSGGIAQLHATTPAWLGGTYRSEATGMPANGLAVIVRGVQSANLPLAAVLPVAGPSCALTVAPLDLGLVLPQTGAVQTSLRIPDQPSLVGLVLHEQIVALELDPLGAIVDATSSNRLTLTLGDF